ncbi:sugar ABC transporter substrate-binding protein [Chloroflexota bacterium]
MLRINRFGLFLVVVVATIGALLIGCARPTIPPELEPVGPTPLEREYQALMVEPGLVRSDLVLNPWQKGDKWMLQKPDGTSFRVGHLEIFQQTDCQTDSSSWLKDLVKRAGGQDIFFDPAGDPTKQLAWLEDNLAMGGFDGLIAIPADQGMLAPVLEEYYEAGTTTIMWELSVKTDKITSFVRRGFLGEEGANLMGEQMVEWARERGPFTLLEVWGTPAHETSRERHQGFRNVVDQYPELITVIESTPAEFNPDKATSICMDAVTANPEINACYTHGGDAGGCAKGFDAVGRLVPTGEPGHITYISVDQDNIIADLVDRKLLDGCSSHSSTDSVDVCFKVLIEHMVLGNEIPKDVQMPLTMLTQENINTEMKWGALACWAKYPKGRWDLRPPYDTTEIGIRTPTIEDREESLGY